MAYFCDSQGKLSWHSIIAAYTLALFLVDVLDIALNQFAHLYQLSTHLLRDPAKDNLLGIILSDVLILPLTAVIFCYYTRPEHPWRYTLLFTLLHVINESIYLSLGYLHYHNWSILYSTAVYMFGIRLFAYYAPRFVSYDPPIPLLDQII